MFIEWEKVEATLSGSGDGDGRHSIGMIGSESHPYIDDWSIHFDFQLSSSHSHTPVNSCVKEDR